MYYTIAPKLAVDLTARCTADYNDQGLSENRSLWDVSCG